MFDIYTSVVILAYVLLILFIIASAIALICASNSIKQRRRNAQIEDELIICQNMTQLWGARAVQESKLRSLLQNKVTLMQAAHPKSFFISQATYRYIDFSDGMMITHTPDYFSHTTPAESEAIGELEKL